MSYRSEFPDYDGDFYLPEGWTDASWHNDTMPRALWYLSTPNVWYQISIWQDYVDENKREYEGEPRYIFQIEKENDEVFEYRTNDLEEIKLLAKGVNVMRDKIKGLLDEKVNEVFAEMQSELKIEHGDIEPLMALRLDEELDRLTEMIRDILGMQKGAGA